jgi:hypothetical protein
VSASADYDLVVLGAGPGGYVAAIRAAQLGLRTAVVERDRPGGVCGNWGCIPSKAILSDAALFAEAKAAARRGIVADGLRVDYARVVERSREVADRQAKGVASLFKKNGIAYRPGVGRLVRGGVAVTADGAAPVELGEERLVLRATDVPSVHVREDDHARRPKRVERIRGFLERPVDVRKGKRREEAEVRRVIPRETRRELVHLSRLRSRDRILADGRSQADAGRGYRDDGRRDVMAVHEGNRFVD